MLQHSLQMPMQAFCYKVQHYMQFLAPQLKHDHYTLQSWYEVLQLLFTFWKKMPTCENYKNYGTAQFKIDTRVQQTRVHLTDFVEAHASYSHAGCMAREYICTIEYTARERAYTRHDRRELRHEARQKPIARKQIHSRG